MPPQTTTPPAPETYTHALAAARLPACWRWRVELRPRRRTIGATVEPGATVVFTAPPVARPDQVAWFARTNVDRITRPVLRAEQTAPAHPVKQIANGEGFALLGTPYRLHLVDDGQPCAVRRLPTGQLRQDGTGSMGSLPFLCLRRDVDDPAGALVRWLAEQGQAYMTDKVPPMAARLDVAPGLDLLVRTLRQHPRTWATYHPATHTVRVHWSVFQLPRPLVHYVLAHEVAHAARPAGKDHGPGWQALVTRLCPDWREQAAQLEQAGRTLWIGDTAPRTDGPVEDTREQAARPRSVAA